MPPIDQTPARPAPLTPEEARRRGLVVRLGCAPCQATRTLKAAGWGAIAERGLARTPFAALMARGLFRCQACAEPSCCLTIETEPKAGAHPLRFTIVESCVAAPAGELAEGRPEVCRCGRDLTADWPLQPPPAAPGQRQAAAA